MSTSEKKYVRNEEGKFVCPHCDKITEKQNTMYYHIKKIHDKDLPFECTLCDDTKFLQRSGLLHHMATIHTDIAKKESNPYVDISFTCPDTSCGHKTHTKSNLLIHYVRTHGKSWIPAFTKESPCTGCQRTFASSSAYLYHCVTCFQGTVPPAHANMISRIR